jgi:putative CRISPR-associated protein (TIGR02619 family)
MPSHHHLLTVGISLLTNFAKARNLPVDEAARHHKAIAEFLQANPREACAEICSLDSRTEFLSGKAPGFAVTLAFTTTEKGKLCASLIAKELKRHKVQVHKLPVRGVDAPAREREWDPKYAQRECACALQDLRERILAHVMRLIGGRIPLRIELNCTGGYKAECAVLYEVGRALRLPVYYLHETFQVAVELP